MEGRILIALVLSAASFCVIFVLDVIEDSRPGDSMSKVIQNIINALSILIGFTWEGCFDGGVEAVASVTENPVMVKLCMTIMVVIVIVPAWRRYILVKVMHLKSLKQARDESRLGSIPGEEEQLLKGPSSNPSSPASTSNRTLMCW